MKLSEVGSYALHQLRQRPLRTILTTCGVAVGVTALVVLVSLASGVERFLIKQFTTSDLMTRITVQQRGGPSLFQDRDEKPGPPLTEVAISGLDGLPGVVAAYPVVRPFVLAEANERVEPAAASAFPVRAITQSYKDALLEGAYWESDSADPVCVVPSSVLAELGFVSAKDAIGKTLAVTSFMNEQRYTKRWVELPEPDGTTRRERRYTRPKDLDVRELTVIGVYDSEQFGLEGMYLHLPLAEGMLVQKAHGLPDRRKEGEFQAAIVKISDPDPIAVDAIQIAISERGYATQTIYDILKPLEWVFFVIKGLLGVFGGIGLVVAFFGIANTMLMAVLERTREIGVLKALGARDRDVRRIFLCEALTIGFLGGLFGLAFGWAGGGLADMILSSVAKREVSVFLVTPALAAVVIGIAMFVAGVAGLYPAWRAARLIPVEALRRD